MGERTHKAEGEEKKTRAYAERASESQVTHPVLHLQQLVGNKTVTNMIQRHAVRRRDVQRLERLIGAVQEIGSQSMEAHMRVVHGMEYGQQREAPREGD